MFFYSRYILFMWNASIGVFEFQPFCPLICGHLNATKSLHGPSGRSS